MRVTGFSSWPPFCRLARVAAKSAALKAATPTNRARFSLFQKRWWLGASGRAFPVEVGVVVTDALTLAADSSSLASETACAKPVEQNRTGTIPANIHRLIDVKKSCLRMCLRDLWSNGRNSWPRNQV